MESKDEIYKRIPHRPPFLWVDRIIELNADEIETEKTVPADLDVFAGHYPGHPILPGVLMCEAVFQSGALLISETMAAAGAAAEWSASGPAGLPILTRIQNAKFKRQVAPGDILRIRVKLTEINGAAIFLKGKMTVNGETALKVDFACTLSSGSADLE